LVMLRAIGRSSYPLQPRESRRSQLRLLKIVIAAARPLRRGRERTQCDRLTTRVTPGLRKVALGRDAQSIATTHQNPTHADSSLNMRDPTSPCFTKSQPNAPWSIQSYRKCASLTAFVCSLPTRWRSAFASGSPGGATCKCHPERAQRSAFDVGLAKG